MECQECPILKDLLPSGSHLSTEDVKVLFGISAVEYAIDLGTHNGASARILSVKAKRVMSCDVFENVNLIENDECREWYKELNKEDGTTYAHARHYLSRFPNVFLYQCETHYFLRELDNESVDLVFVDADHTFEGVSADYADAFPKLNIGGLIAFHDTNGCGARLGPVKFCAEIADKDERLECIRRPTHLDSITVYRKVKR
jgi:hypothetical protein